MMRLKEAESTLRTNQLQIRQQQGFLAPLESLRRGIKSNASEIKQLFREQKILQRELVKKQNRPPRVRHKILNKIALQQTRVSLRRIIIRNLEKKIRENMIRPETEKALRQEIMDRQEESVLQKKQIRTISSQLLTQSPLTKKALPPISSLRDRLASLSRRNERIVRFETKIRSDIIMMVSGRTPCKIVASIWRAGIASVEEALLALARGHEDAIINGNGRQKIQLPEFKVNDLQLGNTNPRVRDTNEGGVSGWEGHVTAVTNQGANCAMVVAEMLYLFARSPGRKNEIIQTFRERNNVKMAGTISVSRRIVYRKQISPGRLRERFEDPEFFRARPFNLGVPIVKDSKGRRRRK